MVEDLEGEVWKDIPGYEGKFRVSNYGNVINTETLKSPNLRKKNNSKALYFYASHGKDINLARLVYSSFIGDIPHKYVVMYKDNNEYNCHVDNLYIINNGENFKRLKYKVGDIFYEHYKLVKIDRIKAGHSEYYFKCLNCGITFKRRHVVDNRVKFRCACYGNLIGNTIKGLIILSHSNEKHTYTVQCTKCNDIIDVNDSFFGSQYKKSVTTKCSCNNTGSFHSSYNFNRNVRSRHKSMMSRCYDKNNKNYNEYGGKGITVCKYLHKLKNYKLFIKSFNKDIEWLVLDRIDPRFEYAPYNCQLLTISENSKKVFTDKDRSNFQLKIDEIKFKRRKKNWIKAMKKKGYKEEDLI